MNRSKHGSSMNDVRTDNYSLEKNKKRWHNSKNEELCIYGDRDGCRLVLNTAIFGNVLVTWHELMKLIGVQGTPQLSWLK